MKEKEDEYITSWDLQKNYIGWFGVLAICLIFFLGALHDKYQYPSGFVQNVTINCGYAVKTLYGNGEKNPFWFWLAPIIIIGSAYYFITDFIKWMKWKNQEFKKRKERKHL